MKTSLAKCTCAQRAGHHSNRCAVMRKASDSDKINQLPKWAQDEIARLSTDVEYWKRKAHQATGDAPTNTFLRDIVARKDLGLPAGSTIRFSLPGGFHGVDIDVCVAENGELSVRATDAISIVPVASNALVVERRKDY